MEVVTIFNRLAVLRVERHLSRSDLAVALGINYQTIGYLERGEYNPSLALALKISQFFEVPVEVVFSLTPFPPLRGYVFQNETTGEKGFKTNA